MTLKLKPLTLTIGLLCFNAIPSIGAELKITVNDAWARATVPAQSISGAFLEIKSFHSSRLIKAETTAADVVELHRMTMTNGVMRMRQLKELGLPAGKTIALSPGGDHLMLINLKKQLRAGEALILNLTIQGGDNKLHTIAVNAKVK